MNSFLDIAMETAREAGAILLSEFSKPAQISYKGDVSIVTQADQRSEAVVVARLRNHFPKHTVVAEEGTGHEHLASAATPTRYRWYVDPLDGTTNFAHSYPCFAVSIALAEAAEDGADAEELLAGVVYNPVSGEMFTAARGEGAYLNQKRIRVSSVEKVETSLLSTGFPSSLRGSPAAAGNIEYYARFTRVSHGVRRDGSAALDLCGVACGRFEGFWEFGLKPWDSAAGVLLVREAGGTVTQLDGQPFRLRGPNVLASNARVHEEMRAIAADIEERGRSQPA